MDAFELSVLALGILILSGMVTGIEWMPHVLRRSTVSWTLGVGHEPELRGELAKAFAIVWLCRAVQLGLVGVVIWTRPAGISWIPILGAFVLSLAAYFRADRTRRSLLA
jgi:hypothetical protein